jgi:flotillin
MGKAGLRIPFFERLDKMSLDLMTIDIKTDVAIPTKEFISIYIDGVANVKINSDLAEIKKSAPMFLAKKVSEIESTIKEVLEGNMREIVGQMEITELVHNRDLFAEKVKSSATEDLGKMGLVIATITIQNFRDDNDVLVNLGVDNTERIRKDAQIVKLEAQKEVAIQQAKTSQEANDARAKADTSIAIANNEVELKKASLKKQADTAKAEADAAYEIQQQVQQTRVNEAEVDAEIKKRERQVILGAKEAEVTEKRLEAEIKKKADADKYAVEQQAQADKFRIEKQAEVEKFKLEKDAEAKRFKVEQEALAKKAEADALKTYMLAEAEGIKAKATAEAAGILATGEAKAKALNLEADALKKLETAGKMKLVLESGVLPSIVRAQAEPLAEAFGRIGNITMYGEGNGAKLTGDLTNTQVQLSNALKDGLGIDLKTIVGGLGGMLIGKEIEHKQTERKEAKHKAAAEGK